MKALRSVAGVLVVLMCAGSGAALAKGKDSAAQCKSGCNKRCSGASNKAKCVGTCRRACDG